MQTETPSIQQLTTVSPSIYSTPSIPTSALESFHPEPWLTCEDYITTKWGNEVGEWGFPDGSHSELRKRLLPLKFDTAGRIYFFDFMNWRLLRYTYPNTLAESISLESLVRYSDPFPFYLSIDVRNNKIFIPHEGNFLTVISPDGEVLKTVELPLGFDVFLPGDSQIQVDPTDRLCTYKGMYNRGWEEGRWEKVSGLGCLNSYFWEDYIVSQVLHVFPEIRISLTRLSQPAHSSLIYTGLPQVTYPSLFGVDRDGNAYLVVNQDPPVWLYARYNLRTRQVQIVKLWLGEDYTVAIPSANSDGLIYVLTYSDKDLAVPPIIVRCELVVVSFD